MQDVNVSFSHVGTIGKAIQSRIKVTKERMCLRSILPTMLPISILVTYLIA